jgi:hypothetical protein
MSGLKGRAASVEGMPMRMRFRPARVALTVVLLTVLSGAVTPAAFAGVRASTPPVAQAQNPDGAAAPTQDFRDDRPSKGEFDELAAVAREEGKVRVIVGLPVEFTPEGGLSVADAAQQRREIQAQTDALVRDVRADAGRVVHSFATVPLVTLELPPRAVEALRRSRHVASVTEDVAEAPLLDLPPPDAPQLAESTPLVQGDLMAAAGHDGAGQTVAILDTGVEAAHSFFGGRVVEEACYALGADGSSTAPEGDCPNGLTSQTGPGSGAACTYAPAECFHGTHVAGISAGSDATLFGVAPAASVMSIQVFSRFEGTSCGGGTSPCARTWRSDQIRALEQVYALRDTYHFAAVNMSLGGQRHFEHCDSDPRKTVIDNLLSVGIPTVVASGNNGFVDSVSTPACISTAVAVGATYDDTAIASFSNTGAGSLIDLVAPGQYIVSAELGGLYGSRSGTSMAAPHVAGAYAALRDYSPSLSASDMLTRLTSTGKAVTDGRTGADGRSHPSIRVFNAGPGSDPPSNDAFASATDILLATSYSTSQSTVAATAEEGEPTSSCFSPGSFGSVWFRFTASVDTTVTFASAGSGFDTGVAAYTGSAVSSLTEVACNDDSAAGVTDSSMAFPAAAGTTYYLQVRGAGAATGSLSLQLSAPGQVGMSFVPMTPCAVFDTRFGGGGAVAHGEARAFQVTGAVPTTQGGAGCPAPPAEAAAVMLNLVALTPGSGGNLKIAPAGVVPGGGVVNYLTGVTNSSALPVEVDAAGRVEVTPNTGVPLDVRGVVLGYYLRPGASVAGTTPLSFVPITPCAVFDTRDAAAGAVAHGEARSFQVTGSLPGTQGAGACTAPPVEAKAVAVNLVALSPTTGGNLKAAAAGVTPDGGVVNFSPGLTNSNEVPVDVDDSGMIAVTPNTGDPVNVRGVALGYYVPVGTPVVGATPLSFVPSTPCALFDTRFATTTGAVPHNVATAFAVTGSLPLGQGGVACPTLPVEAPAVELNLVAVGPTSGGNLKISAAGVVPSGGVVNFESGFTNSNALPVEIGAARSVEVTANTGEPVHVRGVALGYYLPA